MSYTIKGSFSDADISAVGQNRVCFVEFEVRKKAKIRNRYNKAPNLTKDTNGKVTTSQLDITYESQEVSPFQAGDHKASTQKHNKTRQK